MTGTRQEVPLLIAFYLARRLATRRYTYGYGRSLEDLTFVLGFPDWVFWGIIVPWSVCVAFSFYFGATFMRDHDLGEELPETEDELGLGGG